MTNRRKTLLLALLLALATALPAAARPGGGPHGDGPRGDGRRGDGPRGEGSGPRWERMLDLSEEQSAELDALRTEHRGQAVESRKELRRLRHEIEGLMMDDAPDAGALEKLIRKAGELKTGMKVQGMKHRLEMREVLTDVQRDRLLLMKPGHGKRGFHGPRGDGPGRDRCGRGCGR